MKMKIQDFVGSRVIKNNFSLYRDKDILLGLGTYRVLGVSSEEKGILRIDEPVPYSSSNDVLLDSLLLTEDLLKAEIKKKLKDVSQNSIIFITRDIRNDKKRMTIKKVSSLPKLYQIPFLSEGSVLLPNGDVYCRADLLPLNEIVKFFKNELFSASKIAEFNEFARLIGRYKLSDGRQTNIMVSKSEEDEKLDMNVYKGKTLVGYLKELTKEKTESVLSSDFTYSDKGVFSKVKGKQNVSCEDYDFAIIGKSPREEYEYQISFFKGDSPYGHLNVEDAGELSFWCKTFGVI